MTTVKQIHFICTFRDITQKESDIALAFEPNSADIRISESNNYKGIQKLIIHQIVEILNINYKTLNPNAFRNMNVLMECFL